MQSCFQAGPDLFQKAESRTGHSHHAAWARSPQAWRRAQNPMRVQTFAEWRSRAFLSEWGAAAGQTVVPTLAHSLPSVSTQQPEDPFETSDHVTPSNTTPYELQTLRGNTRALTVASEDCMILLSSPFPVSVKSPGHPPLSATVASLLTYPRHAPILGPYHGLFPFRGHFSPRLSVWCTLSPL